MHRSSEGVFYLRNPDGSSQAIALGDKDDLPVTGDWNGDGITDLGVYDSATATFQLRYVGASGVAWLAPVGFGVAGDLPVVGDWNGDGDDRPGHLARLVGHLRQPHRRLDRRRDGHGDPGAVRSAAGHALTVLLLANALPRPRVPAVRLTP